LQKYEQEALEMGYRKIAGVDEAGRGSLAGPVVAAAVIFPFNFQISGIKDSKKLSFRKRENFFGKIFEKAEAVGVGVVDQDEIDQINIGQAGLKAMQLAIFDLGYQVDWLLVDGIVPLPTFTPQKVIKGGDNLSHSIAAASIIAKVTRDRIMIDYHSKYPNYNFARHKGYGTKEHREAIRRYGPCKIHRKTFRGVREYL
jgi:ribonuclease HII